MNLFDLHCDTPYRCYMEKSNIFENNFHVSVERASYLSRWIQCMAIWMPDDLRGPKAVEFFNSVAENFYRQKKIPHVLGNTERISQEGDLFILTVEGGSALGGDLKNVEQLAQKNVKMMTLTWNSENEIGGGVDTDVGLTSFGKSVIKKLEDNNIIVDLSHACDRLFFNVAEFATKPFIASHSNSRKLCPHKRNLTDEQFTIIKNSGGIVGINFCRSFLSKNTKVAIDDIYRHVEHFLSLGGENTVAIGSDFDGADMPDEIFGIEDMYKLYEYLLRKNYSEKLVNKIFFDNAYSFFSGN